MAPLPGQSLPEMWKSDVWGLRLTRGLRVWYSNVFVRGKGMLPKIIAGAYRAAHFVPVLPKNP
jgi:hypothetical protein